MTTILVQLSESDKRVIFSIAAFLIIILVIISFIGSLIVKTMKLQGKEMDTLTYDVTVGEVIQDEKTFIKYALRKNNIAFYKQSRIPLLILLIGALILVISMGIMDNWSYNIFDYHKTGIGTLFFIWDWSNCYSDFFGIQIISSWPKVTLNTPHFEVEAIPSYIFAITTLVGGIWYLHSVQKLISRLIQIRILVKGNGKEYKGLFVKDLAGYNQNEEKIENIKQQMKQ